MIVRISNEGQYELADDDAEALNQLDNQAVTACQSEDAAQFKDAFGQMIDFVRSKGRPLDDDQLEGSDVILPPPDSSLEEAMAEFTGEGLIPD